MKKIRLAVFTGICIALAVSLYFNFMYKNRIENLETERMELLSEHSECLLYKEQSLKKELMSKYLDSMMLLLDKVEEGGEPTEKELADFYDRAAFIEKNSGTTDTPEEEKRLLKTFVESAKKMLESSLANNKKEKN